MDSYEATKIVFSRIQSLDPDNASKAMGYILWQDQGEKEMIRLAFGPETLLLSVINQAKTHLGLPSTTPSTPSSPSPFSPFSNQTTRPSHLHQSSPRIVIPNNGYHVNPSSPSSPWSVSGFSDHRSPSSHLSPRPGSSLSYAAVVNGTGTTSVGAGSASFSPPVAATSFPPSFYNSSSGDPNADYTSQVQEQLSFLDDSSSGNLDFADPIMSPTGRSDSVPFPYGSCGDSHHHHLHRRSCSVSDAFLGGGVSEDGGGAGFGWRPCMYFARGFCKNGSTCKFMHGGGGFADSPDGSDVGSPGKMDSLDEFLRMKAIQQQRFAAASQLMAGGGHFPYNKGMMSFMNDSPRSAAAAAALIMGDDLYKFGRFRSERPDLFALSNANSSSRQIYLTFPADSTFKEEDVSAYFSKFGPVQDVRIPYQQKRMFGFVTFIYSDTVKMILAKGNPHFVCDSRVLVKPYKEKGKIPDKKQHPLDRGEYMSGLDPFDLPIGPRLICDPQDILLRRKIEEQAELQQAIELHGRRLRNLQLMDLQNHPHHGHGHPLFHPNFAAGLPSPPSILQNHPNINQFQYDDDDGANEDNSEGDNNNVMKEKLSNYDEALSESFEHILPDNLFASPTKKATGGNSSLFSVVGEKEGDDGDGGGSSSVLRNTNISILPASALNMASSIKSCYFQMPRFSSGQEAIEM